MKPNEKLIHDFYTCFSKGDYQGMGALYADDATFSDPIFKNLTADQTRAMWEMLLSRAKDLRIEFSNISAGQEEGDAHWDAYYTFSATGKKVINRIDSRFRIRNGKIIKHVDQFDFYLWATQALGLMGYFFGWTSFLKRKIRNQAIKNLNKFISEKG